MKNISLIKFGFIFLFLFIGSKGIAQTFESFSIRENIELKGSMVVVGNNILGKDNLPSNDNSIDNQDISMQYIDIDSDTSTFSSSSAELIMPTLPDGSPTTCYRLAYAGLYWGATLQSGSRADINKVKFKLPGSTTYVDIDGELIYDAISNPIPAGNNEPGNTPYASYADVTDLLSSLSNNIQGEYTVANVTSSEGFNASTGLSAGWTLVVIYENPDLNMKSFTTFDGFSHVYDSHTEDIGISGFATPQAGAVDFQYAYAVLDGDKTKRATKFELNGKEVTTPLRSANKFFGSVIENTNGVSFPRNPSGTNTLGYDTGFLEVLSAEPEYIQNNDTSATMTLQVAKGQADPVFLFFSAFAVDIISPDIDLTKIVVNAAGDDINNNDVNLGENLFYEITYQSVGNDNVTQFTLKDVLPDNIVFDPTTGIDLSNAGGATLQSYDPATRTLIFNIPDGSVQINDPEFVIRLSVQIVSNCYDLSQACSNEIRNQAFATYRGIINPTIIEEEGSFATVECLRIPESTNFLVDISNCTFERDEVLCGSSVVLTAADGYDSYSWSTSPSGTPVISTVQTYTATATGTYYVTNTTSSACISIEETINVIPYGNTITNPVIPFADILPICPNDGKVLPNIFLCGANDTRVINTGISDAVSIIWEKLDETSCADITIDDCANENPACTWNQVATGPNYTANTSGQFRIVINYPGGCFSVFYFDVYQNLLDPNFVAQDIICTTSGEITVGGVPSGYEYSIDGTNYQTSNNFSVTTQGFYTIFIRQIGVDTNPCIFEIPDIYIRDRNFSVTTTTTQPYCYGDKGSIQLAVNDAFPQYYYDIYEGTTLVNSIGPILESDYTFSNLNAGSYTVNVSTDDGCTFTEDIEIIEPAVLIATSALTRSLTCTDGEITVYPVGGTPPYLYYVNSTTDFQNTPQIPVLTSGVYDIIVVDANNCSVTTSITVDEIPAPVFNITTTDVLCYGDNAGQIQFNVTEANGYTINYSIDNGATYAANPLFSNLIAGTYQTIIRYSLGGIECFSTPQDIIINEPAAALTATAGVSELAGCGPSGEGRVRITNPQGGVAPYEYSFDNQTTWSNINNAYLAPGTYTLYIRDINGCVFTMPNVTVDPEPLAPTIDVSDPDFNCDGSANSTVTITNTGSNSFTYTYLIDGVENPNTADPTTFLNIPEGSHTITVTYQLQTVSTFSNLLNETFGYGEDTTSPGINSTYYCFERQVVATQCNDDPRINDGDYSVTADILNPLAGWIDPIDHTPATSPPTPNGRFLAINIGASIPTSAILYEKFIDDIIPNQPINVEFFALNLLRSTSSSADPDLTVALLDVSGNEISSFSTGNIPKTEAWENYALTLNPGANTSLRFVIRSNVQQTSGNDVAIDDITVYQLPTSCVKQVDFPIVIGSGNAFNASIVSATDVTCFGANDGTITITAQNFDTANGFQYSLDAGVTWVTQFTSPYTITGLAAGNQNVQIRYEDAPSTCEFTFSQNIATSTPVGVSVTATPITCLDGSTVTATGSGGTPSYSYELLDTSLNLISNFPANGILANVVAGDYIIRVTDANSCTETTTLNLINPTPPAASIIITDYCYDATNGASLEVSASGGIAPYEYNINGSAFQSNPVFGNLTPGTYTVIVRDAYGCTVTLPVETIEPQVSINVTLTKELDCTTSSDAVISGTISAGYLPYTYAVSFNGGTYTDLGATGTAFTYNATTGGTYQFQVIDDNGCPMDSNVITINPIELPTATTTAVNPSCNGEANGSVQIIPADGVGPYEFSFDGSAFTTTSFYTGLVAGTYAYQVRDSKDCIFTGSVTLTEPTVLAVSASATAFSCDTSNTNQSALITIDLPTTGTAPYLYSFNGSGYSSTNTLTVNDNGTDQTITYSVQDAQGCTAGGSLVISQLNPPTDLIFTSTAITCTTTTSTVDLTATNGVGILEYETIAPSPIIIAKQTSNVFTGLTPGTYLFRVTDANGCYYSESYVIDPVTPITITSLKLSDVFCFGDNTGAIRYTVSGFSGTYSSTLTNGSGTLVQTGSTVDLTDLIADTYTLEVIDDITGCTANATIVIEEPANPLTFTATSTNVNCNEFNSQITVTATGGTPSYTYAAVVSGAAAPASYTNSNVITVDTNLATDLVWDVYVRDANGCITVNTVTITADPLPTVTAPSVDNQCNASSGFTFTVSATGVAPLTYSINGGASYQSSPTFTVNTSGSFTITVRDGNGCTATSTGTTEVFPPITASALLTKDLTCSVPTEATIDITVSGGNAPYNYAVSTDGGVTYNSIVGSPYTTSVAGNYQFEITDANGCTRETNVVTVTTPVNPVIDSVIETQSISCNGEETAAVQVNYNNTIGTAPFVINVNNDTTGTDYGTQTSGLAAGNYTITLTDANGCFDTDIITIGEPTPIVPIYHAEPITCGPGGISKGSVIVDSVTGGTPPYNYFVTGTNGYSASELNNTGTTSTTFDVVDFGLYQINIVDSNGCSILIQNVLVASPPDDLDIDINTTVNCATGGEADVSIGSSSSITGAGPFYFAIYTGPGMVWDGVPGGSATWQLGTGSPVSTTFTGLIPDVTYTFVVYDDDTMCYYFETADTPIETNSTLDITALTANNITCTGSADGTVSFDITSIYGVDTDVTYEIFDSQSLAPITPTAITGSGTVPANGVLSVTNLGLLDFGNYVVVIEEITGPNTGCGVATVPFNITESAIDLSVSASVFKNENCNELGIISAIAQDGTAPYEYQLVLATDPAPIATSAGWASANTFTATADNYIVYAKDAYGCIRQAPVTLDRDPEPTINPVPQQCFDGTPITITLVEGTGTAIAPLSYSIGGTYQSSDTFTITSAGTYNISIRDGNGCIATTTYIVETPLLLDADLTQDLTCAVDANIDLLASGGTGTYSTYEVSINGGIYSVISGSPYVTTTEGTYQFRVTDSQGCQAESSEIIVTPRTTPTLTETHVDVTCNGGSDGSIVVTAANGIAPYEYSNDNGVSFQSSNVFSGLIAGTYDILVRDSKSCLSIVVPVTIDEPTLVGGSGVLTQGLTCGAGNATQPALVTITGSGGTAPYSYSFDGGVNYTTTNTFSTYTSGTVSAFIRDANGCTILTPVDVVVPALDIPTDLDFSATAVTCSALTSDVTLTATNGVGPLSYEIIAPASATGNTTGATTGIFTGLAPETYTFTVTDANGCTYTESYTVTPVTNITVSGLLVSDVNCNGASDGAVDFTVGNFASTYSYTINGGAVITGQTATTINLTGLAIGDQIIVVTDETTDCTATFTVSVSEPAALVLIETVNINANCNFGSQVSVEANGGTPNYLYAFVQDGVAPLPADYTTSASAVLDPAVNTNWDVWVIDSNGCTDQIDIVIDTDPEPTVTVPTLASNQCNLTGDPYTFDVINTTGVAPFTYSIGSGFQSSTTFTVSSPGDYFVTVRDANGCEAISATSVTVYPTIDVSSSVTALPSCADDDGEITMTGSGGSGNYTYTISPTAGSISISGNMISGVPAGTYTVTITDATTLCTRDISVTLDAPTPVTFTTTPTPVSCTGGSDGIITVNLPASNDNPIYTYSLDGGVTTQTSNVFSGLAAGTYNVTVTSGRNCTLTQLETVIDPSPIIIPTPTVIEYACTANTNTTVFATITVNGVTGGSSNYTIYEFIRGGSILQANASNVYTETDLLGGTYTINVYDDNGCFETTTATIQPFIRLDTLDITVNNAITCTNDEDITVSVTSSGGTPTNLQYSVEDVDGATIGAVYSQTNPTGIFTNLPIGNYLVTVLNLDSGCSLQTTHYINEPNTFDLTIDNVVDVTCFTDSNGSVNVTFIDRSPTPTDESGAFNYNVVDASGNLVTSGAVANAGPTTISGLVSGTYTITASLTNTPFCTVVKNFTINAPTTALAISETHTEITCVSGNNDGSISASATGGWPGAYEYQLELTSGTIITSFSTVSNFTDLTAGDYIVSVRDSRGCIASTNVLLVIPTPIDAQITAVPTLVSCFGDTNASITVSNVTGGQGANYTYTLNMVSPTPTSSGPQNSNVFGGLGAGTYNVTVRDGWNCEFTTTDVVIAEPTDIISSLVKETSQTCLTGATLTLSATGGIGLYEYSDTMNFATVLGSFVSDVTFNVTPGTYQYYVRDANGCVSSISNEITIDPLPPLTVNIDATNATINCTGDFTGVIRANATGGLGNYTYILQDNFGTDITPAPTQNSPGVFTELPAGIYQVRVTSGIDCEVVSTQVEITEPDFALQVSYTVTDVACSGGDDGVLEIIATGGTGIIKYAISPQLNQFFETATFEDLPAGTYQAIAQDELGCFVLIDFVVNQPDPVILSLVPNSIIPEACVDELDGEFSVNITGGNLPYSVSLDDINGTYTTGSLTQTQFDFTGLAGGDHVVFVRDNLGCESEWNITFPESVRIVTEVDIAYCIDNSNDASINMVTAIVDDTLVDLSDLDYSLDGGAFQSNNTFMDLLPGNHYITVRHTNTCESIVDFEIEQFDPLQLVIADGNINEIVATSTGGSGVYEYEVQFENSSSTESYGSTNIFPIYESGNYTVTVTDSNGCVAVATAFFEYFDVCITNYFTPNSDGRQDEWGPDCTDQYPNLTVNIFDRYGREVSKLRVGQKWDGKYNGVELPSGDYWYVVKLNDERDDREFVGHFTLYR